MKSKLNPNATEIVIICFHSISFPPGAFEGMIFCWVDRIHTHTLMIHVHVVKSVSFRAMHQNFQNSPPPFFGGAFLLQTLSGRK